MRFRSLKFPEFDLNRLSVVFTCVLCLFCAAYSQARSPFELGRGQRSATFLSVPLVEGRVLAFTGDILPGAKVTLTTVNGEKIVQMTDKKGRFQFLDSRVIGQNRIVVEHAGFVTFVDHFDVVARERVAYNVSLRVGAVDIFEILPGPPIDMRSSDITTTFRVN